MSKYIVVIMGDSQFETPIMFPDYVTHDEVYRKIGGTLVSAGFFTTGFTQASGDYDVSAFGSSTSLGIGSRPEDAALIKNALYN